MGFGIANTRELARGLRAQSATQAPEADWRGLSMRTVIHRLLAGLVIVGLAGVMA